MEDDKLGKMASAFGISKQTVLEISILRAEVYDAVVLVIDQYLEEKPPHAREAAAAAICQAAAHYMLRRWTEAGAVTCSPYAGMIIEDRIATEAAKAMTNAIAQHASQDGRVGEAEEDDPA